MKKPMKSTPGPWRWTCNNKYLVQDVADAEVFILENYDDAFEGPLKEANARLIAAAPELLEALKELEGNARQAAAFVPHILLIGAVEQAAKAIAKAEGREE